jgi:hypothetical protein
MKAILIAGLALASLTTAAVATAEPVRKEMIIRVDDAWRDCAKWDRRHHICRDAEWDRSRWVEHDWYGHKTCGANHDHYLDARGHWRTCG